MWQLKRKKTNKRFRESKDKQGSRKSKCNVEVNGASLQPVWGCCFWLMALQIKNRPRTTTPSDWESGASGLRTRPSSEHGENEYNKEMKERKCHVCLDFIWIYHILTYKRTKKTFPEWRKIKTLTAETDHWWSAAFSDQLLEASGSWWFVHRANSC